MAQHLFFNPRRRENALWASAVETYLRRRHPNLPLRELRNLPMMQGVYRHLREWEAGRVLPYPENPEALARLGEVERQALLSQAFLGLATLHGVAAAAGEDFYNDTFIPAVLTVDSTLHIRQFSTDDLAGFASCLVIWAYYYWAGLPEHLLPLVSRLLDAVVAYLDLTPEQIAEIRQAQQEIEALLAQIPATGYRTAPPGYGAIAVPDDSRFILLGDWGTSLPDAEALLEAIWDQTYTADPTRTILFLHLGDIYYSGLPVECQQNFYDVFARVRQTLIQRYGPSFADNAAQSKIFAIPGNHEYYSKGYGYFQLIDQLDTELGTGQECSFFCLRTQNGGWQVLGMDTGQGDHNAFEPIFPKIKDTLMPWIERRVDELVPFPLNLWVDHWIEAAVEEYTGPFAPQLQASELAWHKARLAEAPSTQTILLSHHQLFSAAQEIDHHTPQFLNTHLLEDFRGYFLNQVPLWFWGHEHSYAIYQWGLFGLDRGRLLGSSSYETSQQTDHPYRVAYPEVPFDPGMSIPHQTEGFFDHACAVLDLADGNLQFYGFPSWGQEDVAPASPQLYWLFGETVTPAQSGAFQAQWDGNIALAPDVVDKNGNYQSNPYQSTSAPTIAYTSDGQSLVMVWRDSADNTLHWATGELGTSSGDFQTPTLQWTVRGQISASTASGTTAILSTNVAPVLVGCGKIFLLVFKRNNGPGLVFATWVPGDQWYFWGPVTDPHQNVPQSNDGPGLTAALEGAYLAYADSSNSNHLKWMIYTPPALDGPAAAGTWGAANTITDSNGNPLAASGPLSMCANPKIAFLAYRRPGKQLIRWAYRRMGSIDPSTSPPTIVANPSLAWNVQPGIQVGTTALTTDLGMAIQADGRFLYLVYTAQATEVLQQALVNLTDLDHWRGNLPLDIKGSNLTPKSQSAPGFLLGNQMALLVYPGQIQPHLLEAWV
jgi:hypothetical protein